MKTFIEWAEENTNEAGMFTNMLRSLKGEKLPPDITPDQEDAYNQLRQTGVDHASALRTVMGTPTFNRKVSRQHQDLQADIEGRWGSR